MIVTLEMEGEIHGLPLMRLLLIFCINRRSFLLSKVVKNRRRRLRIRECFVTKLKMEWDVDL